MPELKDMSTYWLITNYAATLESARHWHRDNVCISFDDFMEHSENISSDACALCRLYKTLSVLDIFITVCFDCPLFIVGEEKCFMEDSHYKAVYSYYSFEFKRTKSSWKIFIEKSSEMRDFLYWIASKIKEEIERRERI